MSNNDNAKKPEKKKNAVALFLTDKTIEYKAEFKRIVWPSREELLKQTITVIVISLLFGAYIALLDGAFGATFTALVDWFSTGVS